jgi:hypothetical protein
MKTLSFIFSLLFALSSSSLIAQETSLLWKVSGPNIQDSYLFGTIHLLCSDDLELSEQLKSSLKASDQLVLELDFDDPSMMTEMQKYISMEDATLGDLYTEEELAELKAFFTDKMGIPIAASGRMKPFMLMSLMLPVVLECPPASYEMSLVQLAKTNEQEVLGLETVKEQMDAIDAFPQEDMADMLLDYIQNFEDTREDFEGMIAAYNQQDPDALLEEMNEQLEESGSEQFNEIMLVQRNHKWIERIGNIASEKSSFFAVGAGHLGGPDGVITLLKEAGYTVTPIKQ